MLLETKFLNMGERMHSWPQRDTLESHLKHLMSCSWQWLPAVSPGGVKYSTQCFFPCSFSLPLKICSFMNFEFVVVVGLRALGKLFFHKPCQWLWNPCAIAAPPTNCGNVLSPHYCVPEHLSLLTFHMPLGFPRDVSHFFSHSFLDRRFYSLLIKKQFHCHP